MNADTSVDRRTLLAGAAAAAIGGTDEVLAFVRPTRGLQVPQADAAVLELHHAYVQSLKPAKAAHAVHGPLEAVFYAEEHRLLAGHEREQLKRDLRLDEAEAAVDAAEYASFLIISQLAETPAKTLVGIRAKAAVLQAEDNNIPELVDSLVEDLLQMSAAT